MCMMKRRYSRSLRGVDGIYDETLMLYSNDNIKGVKKHYLALSPVIGILLMLAVTVALVAIASYAVFSIGGSVSETPEGTVVADTSDGQIKTTVVRNGNLESVSVEHPDGQTVAEFNLSENEVGQFYSAPSGGGRYEVYASSENSRELIGKHAVASVDIEFNISGTVGNESQVFNISHDDSDGEINISNTQIWVDAQSACGKSSRLINLPADRNLFGGNAIDDENVISGNASKSIFDASQSNGSSYSWDYGVAHVDSGNYNSGILEQGEFLEFRIEEDACNLRSGQKVTVSFVDVSDNPVIVSQGQVDVS